jgi:glycosyltransferase involved in cell wall biosynthesis
LPNVLLEAAAHGLPVVAPLIGGIGELVSERTAWPVRQPDDAAEFVARLRNISFAFDSSGGDAKVKTMAELIRTRHSFQEFRGAVAALMDGLG